MTQKFDETELRRALRLLNSVLIRVLKIQGKAEVADRVAQLQKRYASILRDNHPARRQQLLEALDDLDPESTGEVIRVFNHYFSLLNIAEES
jgi:phosphoenolpyruvate carboxylase